MEQSPSWKADKRSGGK